MVLLSFRCLLLEYWNLVLFNVVCVLTLFGMRAITVIVCRTMRTLIVHLYVVKLVLARTPLLGQVSEESFRFQAPSQSGGEGTGLLREQQKGIVVRHR